MLAARNRVTEPRDFREVVRKGARTGGPLLVAHLHQRPGALTAAAPRVGFVVSTAVGNAVTRNLVKRRLRHLARERLASLPGGGLAVVRALPAAADASYTELGAELDRCLEACAGKLARAQRSPTAVPAAGSTPTPTSRPEAAR